MSDPPRLHFSPSHPSFKRSFEQFDYLDDSSDLTSNSGGEAGPSNRDRNKRHRTGSVSSGTQRNLGIFEPFDAPQSGSAGPSTRIMDEPIPTLPMPSALEDSVWDIPALQQDVHMDDNMTPTHEETGPMAGEQFRLSMERFNAFDSQIQPLRPMSSRRTSSPPPTLPPLSLPSPNLEPTQLPSMNVLPPPLPPPPPRPISIQPSLEMPNIDLSFDDFHSLMSVFESPLPADPLEQHPQSSWRPPPRPWQAPVQQHPFSHRESEHPRRHRTSRSRSPTFSAQRDPWYARRIATDGARNRYGRDLSPPDLDAYPPLTQEPLAFNYPGLDLYSGTYEDPREANAPRPYSSSPLYPPYSRGRRARDDPPRIPRPRFPSAIRSNSLVSENASELRRSLARSESLGLSRLETEVPRPTLFHPRSPSPLFTMDESHLFDGEVPSMDLDVPFSSQAAALFASRSNSPPPPTAQELRFRREVRANAPRLPQVFAPSPPPSGDRMDDNAPIRRFLGGSTLWRTHEEARLSMERESWTTSRPHPSADLRRRATTREATAQSTRTSIPSSVPRARQTARPPPTMSRNAVNVPHDRHHMDVNAFHEGPFRSSIERQIEINRLQSRIEHLQAGLGTEAPRGSSPQLPPPPPPPPSIPPVQIDWEPLDPWEGINSTQIPERPEPSAIFRETLTRQVNASTRTRSRFAWDGPVNRESRHIRNNTTDVTRDDDASGDPAMHRHLQSTVGRRSTTTSPWILPRAPSGPEDFTRIRDTIAMLRSESRDLRRDFDVNAYPQPEERRTSRPPHWGEMEATDVSNRPASIRRRFPTRVPGPGLGETPSGTESIPPSRRPRSASVSRLHTAATRSGQTGTTRADMSVERYIALRPGGLGGRRARLGRNLADFIRDEEFDSSYESLLSLAATLGDAKPRSTPEDVIKSLPKGQYKDWKHADSDTRCPICLDDYAEDDALLRVPQCNHWLHQGCLEQWLHGATTCPVCRGRVGGQNRTRSARRARAHPHTHTTTHIARLNGPGTSAAGPSGATHPPQDEEEDSSEDDIGFSGFFWGW